MSGSSEIVSLALVCKELGDDIAEVKSDVVSDRLGCSVISLASPVGPEIIEAVDSLSDAGEELNVGVTSAM